ncbi:MAG: sigma factor-like helix-turn-helix DNA-binding protein [Actinomycetota bacterium]
MNEQRNANGQPHLELVSDGGHSPVSLDFSGFFADHHRTIASALALTLRDDQLASDAAAEAMARAYQRWDDVGRYSNPAGWVYRVGLNWAHSRRRKLVREIFRSESPDLPAPPTPDVDPALGQALAELPVEQRSVVVCRYLLDWSEFQTAEALQIAPGTVKSRLSRGLARLAVLMENPTEAPS